MPSASKSSKPMKNEEENPRGGEREENNNNDERSLHDNDHDDDAVVGTSANNDDNITKEAEDSTCILLPESQLEPTAQILIPAVSKTNTNTITSSSEHVGATNNTGNNDIEVKEQPVVVTEEGGEARYLSLDGKDSGKGNENGNDRKTENNNVNNDIDNDNDNDNDDHNNTNHDNINDDDDDDSFPPLDDNTDTNSNHHKDDNDDNDDNDKNTDTTIQKVGNNNTNNGRGSDEEEREEEEYIDDVEDDNETATTYLDEMPLFHYSRINSTGLPQGGRRACNSSSIQSVISNNGKDDNIDIDNDTDDIINKRQQQDQNLSRASCSELTIARVDPEELSAATTNAMATAAAAAAIINSNKNSNSTTNTTTSNNNMYTTCTSQQELQQAAEIAALTPNEQALILSSDLWRQPHLILACGWDNSNSNNKNNNASSASSLSSTRRGKITFTRIRQQRSNGTVYRSCRNDSISSDSKIDNSNTTSLSPSPLVVFLTPTANAADPAAALLGSSTPPRSSHSNSNNISTMNSNNNASTELHIREPENNSYNMNSWSKGPIYEDTSIIDMSFDSSGTALGAIDEGGHCALWEFKYTTSLQSHDLVFGRHQSPSYNNNNDDTDRDGPTINSNSTTNSTSPPPSPQQVRLTGNNTMFSNFMSAITGMPPDDDRNITGRVDGGGSGSSYSMNRATAIATREQQRQQVVVPTLTAEIIYQSRVNYPANWGPPTCMVIDPAYKRKREKSMLVGFANGRLVLTKRGTFFHRRNDTVIYQAPQQHGGNNKRRAKNNDASNNNNSTNNGDDSSTSSYCGIENVVWRGPLVCWADATGIKLMDMDNLTRIAHIDRPAGARPTLYPTVRNVQPSLCFETSQHLLVGWGDCLMQIHIEEHDDQPPSSSSQSVSSGRSDGSSSGVKKRRTVACTMAWELDCVACDVVPLDADHVVVLGLVPPSSFSEEGTNNYSGDDGKDGIREKGNTMNRHRTNDLEVQILCREDGAITYGDSLPLTDDMNNKQIDSVKNFRLLSSYALPRMNEYQETKVLKAMKGANDMGFIGIDTTFDIVANQPLFAGTADAVKNSIEFRDPHLNWNVQSILYDDENNDSCVDSFDIDDDDDDDDDDRSIDSDDYECILRQMETIEPFPTDAMGLNKQLSPPTMIVCTDSEAILSTTSTIDDAVERSLLRNKCARALSFGLCHKRELRHYSVNELINYYLEAVLRITESECDAPLLSLRRMRLAVKAMPVLLGDKIELWERWTRELQNIPGSLFFLRNYLPVRDPILPSNVFVRVLESMLVEVERMQSSNSRRNTDMHTEAANHFLESLLAWGPTKVLKEYVSFYKYNKLERLNNAEEKSLLDTSIRATQISLQRRYLQTAAGYLIFPVRDIEEELERSAPRYEVHNIDTEDSLFDISQLVFVVASRVPLVASPSDFISTNSKGMGASNTVHQSQPYSLVPNNHTSLEAMARIRLMQGEYDLALKCFLAIGAIHSKDSLQSIERAAIMFVNKAKSSEASEGVSLSPIRTYSYEFVMNIIENQHLNQFLFERDFLLSTTSTESKLFMPIFALIRLVGLHRVGNYLIRHCVEPGFSYNMKMGEANDSSADSLQEYEDDGNDTHILRRSPLPLDKVAEQLESSPALLHWYLYLVFTKRPELYTDFPTNSIPSKIVISLHERHFKLYVKFAEEMRDSSNILSGTEGYKAEIKTTPLLTFLKAALPLGGVLPVNVRRELETERSKHDSDNNNSSAVGDRRRRGGNLKKTDSQVSSSPIFALELAYIIERYSEQTEMGALGILNLYLTGAQSLTLSVSYTQRQTQFSSVLWDHLICYCKKKASDGAVIFGELLEAAAFSGADLARLVERIPPGMVVEGLRERLVAAVADYRMKLEIYKAAMATGSEEETNLMREIGHRVRRGVRYNLKTDYHKSLAESINEILKEKSIRTDEVGGAYSSSDYDTSSGSVGTALGKLSKTRIRRDHQRLAYIIPRR